MTETTQRSEGRVLLAFFVQPLVVAILVFILAFGAGFASVFVVAFLAAPAYVWLQRRGRITFRQTLFSGAILGNLPGVLIVAAAAMTGAGSEPGLTGLTYGALGALRAIAIGTVIGTAAAAVFWWMSGLRRV